MTRKLSSGLSAPLVVHWDKEISIYGKLKPGAVDQLPAYSLSTAPQTVRFIERYGKLLYARIGVKLLLDIIRSIPYNDLRGRIVQELKAVHVSGQEAIFMLSFNEYLKAQLNDHEFKKEYNALEPELSIIQAMIDARKASGSSQKRSDRICNNSGSFV